MTNLLASAESIAHTGKLFAPASDARVAMIDPGDVAAVAAAALVDRGHAGRTYVVTGPEALTYDDIALSQATDCTIEFVDVPDEGARDGMLQAGMPEFVVDFLVRLFGALRAGAQAVPTDTVRAVTGGEPRGIAPFAREHWAMFGMAVARRKPEEET